MKVKRVKALIACGDIMGYNAYTTRVATSPAHFAKFAVSLSALYQEFKKAHPYFFRTWGDGYLSIHEMNGQSAASAEKFLFDLYQFSVRRQKWIEGLDTSRPDGDLLRVGYAELLKIGDDYYGEGINHTNRLLKAARTLPTLCTLAVQEQMPKKTRAVFYPYKNGKCFPDGVTKDDMKNVRSFLFP